MTLQVVCAWCGKDMGAKDGQGQHGITHGICEECLEKQLASHVPRRIQRRRTRGWRMPKGAVYVGRPTMWGNPFLVEKYGREKALEYFRVIVTGELAALPDAAKGTYRKYERNNAVAYDIAMLARIFLKGKDLACWCAEKAPCHADVLLEIANA